MRIIEVDDPIKIILAKQEVEQKLMDEKKLDAPMSLPDFVKSLNMQNNIYIKNDDVIPFSIVDDKLFIIASKEKIEEVDSVLKSIDYDCSRLTEIPIMQVYQGELEKYEQYFVIDSKYMVNKK